MRGGAPGRTSSATRSRTGSASAPSRRSASASPRARPTRRRSPSSPRRRRRAARPDGRGARARERRRPDRRRAAALARTLEVTRRRRGLVVGRRVVVRAPDRAGPVHVVYTVTTRRGVQAPGVLTVSVDPGARALPPSAQDVVVPAVETVGRTEVEVDVLALAENHNGPLSDLAVSVHESAAGVARVSAGGDVVVTLGPRVQTLPYVLTDTGSGLSAIAFVTVPARGDFPPVLRPRAPALTVMAGERARHPARGAGAGRSRAHRPDHRRGPHPGHEGRRLPAAPGRRDPGVPRPRAPTAGRRRSRSRSPTAPRRDPRRRTRVLTLPITVARSRTTRRRSGRPRSTSRPGEDPGDRRPHRVHVGPARARRDPRD